MAIYFPLSIQLLANLASFQFFSSSSFRGVPAKISVKMREIRQILCKSALRPSFSRLLLGSVAPQKQFEIRSPELNNTFSAGLALSFPPVVYVCLLVVNIFRSRFFLFSFQCFSVTILCSLVVFLTFTTSLKFLILKIFIAEERLKCLFLF